MNLTALRRNPAYATATLISNTMVVGIIPILLLMFLNYQIIQTMKKNTLAHNKICRTVRLAIIMIFSTSLLNYRQDQTMIALLSGVVVVVIVCHTPKAVINMYESYQVYFVSFISAQTGNNFQPNFAKLSYSQHYLM